MKKENTIAWIWLIVVILIWTFAFFVSRVSAFDVVSSPTNFQAGWQWVFTWTSHCDSWGGITDNYRTFVWNFWNSHSWSFDSSHVVTGGGFCPDPSKYWINDFYNIGNWLYFTNVYSPWFPFNWHNIFYNSENNLSLDLWTTVPFINGLNVVLIDWSDVKFYTIDKTTMTLGSPTQTIPKPSVSFAVQQWTLPVYIKTDSSWWFWFLYQWTDGKAYLVFDTFWAWEDQPILPGTIWTWSIIPIWKISWEDIIFARQQLWSGSVYLKDTSTDIETYEMSNNFVLRNLNIFQNPVAYFNTSSWSVVKWDLNCQTPLYDSCRLSWWVFKCADSSGTLSPWWELCGGTITPPSNWGNWTIIPSLSGQVCRSQTYNIFSPNSYPIGSWSFTSYSDSSSRSTFYWLSDSNRYQDRFSIYPVYTWSIIEEWTFTGGINSWVPTTISQSIWDTELPASSLTVALVRNWLTAPINYIRVRTDYEGENFFWSNYNNIVANVDFMTANWVATYPMTWSGGYATAFSQYNATSAKITFLVNDTITFDWFETWLSLSGTTTKVSCTNDFYSCRFYQQQPWVFTCDASLNPSGTPQGNCTISGGQCRPVSNTWAYYDGGINIPGVTTTQVGWTWAVVWLKYTWEDLFTCSQTGINVLICPFEIIRKIWAKFTQIISTMIDFMYGVSAIGSPRGTGNFLWYLIPVTYAQDYGVNLISPYDRAGYSGALNPDYAPTYTWADIARMNHAMFTAGDNAKNLAPGGIRGILSFSQWTMILVCSIALFSMVILAIRM